ncbi:hypothetical protein QT397_11720 [Microbulbifer sp. MKSA007]|nr:hypothetical protein QT397_11720 [Microbulbifer sp. MKSA007]
MVHKNFAVALLAATVGACSQLPEQASAPETENIPAEETSVASDRAVKKHEPSEAVPPP